MIDTKIAVDLPGQIGNLIHCFRRDSTGRSLTRLRVQSAAEQIRR